MKYKKQRIIGKDFIKDQVEFALTLFSDYTVLSEIPLHSCNATVLHYKVQGGDVYLLKSYSAIVAMVDALGDGFDFMHYIYGYTDTCKLYIRKFFAEYCEECADIYIYKP